MDAGNDSRGNKYRGAAMSTMRTVLCVLYIVAIVAVTAVLMAFERVNRALGRLQ